jgi:nicotinate-nucleotide adenylyltransferase
MKGVKEMTKIRIGVGGSSANPPHLGHKVLIEKLLLSGVFDRVIWIPSGERIDKESFVDPDHRVFMTNLTFPKEWFIEGRTVFTIKYQDVYEPYSPEQSTIRWLIKIRQDYPEDEIIWFTGADSVMPQEKFGGKCEIEAVWFQGDTLMKNWPFLIIPRKGYIHPAKLSLPKKFKVLDIAVPEISSTTIRQKINQGNAFEHLVVPEVARYIKRFGLYGWKGDK